MLLQMWLLNVVFINGTKHIKFHSAENPTEQQSNTLKANSNDTSSLNSSSGFQTEALFSAWDLEPEAEENENKTADGVSLSFLPDIPDFQFPVCCNINSTENQNFQCKNFQNHETVLLASVSTTTNGFIRGENGATRRFQWRMPKCAIGNKYIIFDPTFDRDEIQSHTKFLNNGYFGHNNEFYPPQEYCINRLTGEFVEVKVCEPEWRIQKCCDLDEIYSFRQKSCIKSNAVLFNPTFYKDMSKREKKIQQSHFSIRFPKSFKYNCLENRTQIFPSSNTFAQFLSNSTGREFKNADFRIRNDGVIMYRKNGKAIVLPNGNPIYLKEHNRKCYTLKTEYYCIDGATEYGDPNEFSNQEDQMFLVTCSENLLEPPVIGPLSFVYGNVMIGSSFFYLLLVLIKLILNEIKNIPGLLVVSYAISMFCTYIFLGLGHLVRYYGSEDVLKTGACVFIAMGSHFYSVSSLVWLTLINVDLWYTFKKIRPTVKSKHNGKLWSDYMKYSIFGWGIPLIIISVSSYLHFNYEESAEDQCADVPLPLPAYGRESCEIKQLSLGLYLYFPAIGLYLCNFVFFIVTIFALCKHEKKTLIALKGLERHHQSIQLFGKLFFVMGVTRIFEVITWSQSGLTLTWYWAVLDIFNILQAVAIFFIYVCKRDTLHALREKIPNIIRIGIFHNSAKQGYNADSLSKRGNSRVHDF